MKQPTKKGGALVLVVVIVVVILLVLFFFVRQKRGQQDEALLEPTTTSTTQPTTTLNTNTKFTPPAETELQKKVDDLSSMVKTMGSDIKAGESMDFSGINDDDAISDKLKDL